MTRVSARCRLSVPLESRMSRLRYYVTMQPGDRRLVLRTVDGRFVSETAICRLPGPV